MNDVEEGRTTSKKTGFLSFAGNVNLVMEKIGVKINARNEINARVIVEVRKRVTYIVF